MEYLNHNWETMTREEYWEKRRDIYLRTKLPVRGTHCLIAITDREAGRSQILAPEGILVDDRTLDKIVTDNPEWEFFARHSRA